MGCSTHAVPVQTGTIRVASTEMSEKAVTVRPFPARTRIAISVVSGRMRVSSSKAVIPSQEARFSWSKPTGSAYIFWPLTW
ncbi:hypothetical protein MPOCJGCO_4553 [Methylobacterium trifolii]|uniref:Uncharacterized protein n=1 Tax=Methylobacterium trifolii TaxID=1003092 RepID=A0ABQ4U9K6_9HYPH|nr:hypothetical protein MPOCJGCO_4553 [Methylobacterium trifolii]